MNSWSAFVLGFCIIIAAAVTSGISYYSSWQYRQSAGDTYKALRKVSCYVQNEWFREEKLLVQTKCDQIRVCRLNGDAKDMACSDWKHGAKEE